MSESSGGSYGEGGSALVRAMAAGDTAALGRVYDEHGGLVYSLALRVLGNAADAEEVLHDVFMQLWRKASSFDAGRGTIAGLLVTMTRNRAIDRLRARRSRPEGASLEAAGDAPSIAPCPLHFASLTEARTAVRAALELLPEAEREVLELAYFEGLSQSQIADRMETPLGTVKGRARNGLRRLRAQLPAGLGGDA